MTYVKIQTELAYALASSSALWTLVSMLLIALRGDLGRPWQVIDGNRALVGRLLDNRPNVLKINHLTVHPVDGN